MRSAAPEQLATNDIGNYKLHSHSRAVIIAESANIV